MLHIIRYKYTDSKIEIYLSRNDFEGTYNQYARHNMQEGLDCHHFENIYELQEWMDEEGEDLDYCMWFIPDIGIIEDEDIHNYPHIWSPVAQSLSL